MSTMPTTLTRLIWVATNLSDLAAERNALIVQARTEGSTLREIASAAGMTHVGVKRLLDRQPSTNGSDA